MRTIGVITTNRADYGVYVPVLKAMTRTRKLTFELYVTGGHCSQVLGTIKDIQRDGFPIGAQVPIDSGDDTPTAITKNMSLITAGFARIFKTRKSDMLLTLGDRYDMHAAAVAAVPFNIPIAHIHGGELTRGVMDEYFRHSLTKLSHLHFASTKAYAKRIIQMGEEPWRVIVSGAPALDSILNLPLMSQEDIHQRFHVNFSRPVLLTTFHPVTLEIKKTSIYIKELLKALDHFKDHHVVFTAPNNDTSGRMILEAVKAYVSKRENTCFIPHFGLEGYLSMMKYSVAMVGNSSSGIIEAPSFQLPVVNIGLRQEGRLHPSNVIDCNHDHRSIIQSLNKALSNRFRAALKRFKNPYGDGQAAERIVHTLSKVDLNKLKVKRFYDL